MMTAASRYLPLVLLWIFCLFVIKWDGSNLAENHCYVRHLQQQQQQKVQQHVVTKEEEEDKQRERRGGGGGAVAAASVGVPAKEEELVWRSRQKANTEIRSRTRRWWWWWDDTTKSRMINAGNTVVSSLLEFSTILGTRIHNENNENDNNNSLEYKLYHHHRHDDDHHHHDHYYREEIVDLLDWEKQSLAGLIPSQSNNVTQRSALYSCHKHLPRHNNGVGRTSISASCCLGSHSNGGSTTPQHRNKCAASLQYHLPALAKHTYDFFQNNPIIQQVDDENDDESSSTMPCDVCRIVELARTSNLTIGFVGDSMHNQIFDGMNCELQRRNYVVRRSTENLNPTNDNTWIFRKYTQCETLYITSPNWLPNEEEVIIKFHRIYLLPLINDDMALRITSHTDVLVLGIGLHFWYDNNTPYIFRRRQQYVEAMRDLFVNTTRQGHVRLLVHRESSAQHFDAHGGEFSLWYPNREKLQKSCQPPAQAQAQQHQHHQNSRNDTTTTTTTTASSNYDDDVYNWREKAIQQAAKQAGHDLIMAGPNMMPPLHTNGSERSRPEIVVLPYFNFTLQHYNMHPKGANHNNPDEMDDCTHYCSSPYIYYPIWRSLRFAMDRQFA